MPSYEYEVTSGPRAGQRFEVFQRMSEDPLTKHPETGDPVRRVVSAPMIGGKHSEAGMKKKMSDSNFERLGFTKYVKTEKGKYDKAFGGGPGSIQS